ncbi:MFS transporter [Chengkuizengella axinellae]|uniref:MFS transporter n=1 Tax=Chengkuizengella axinellae TaxID=3064388 RepID=A0ABT9J4J8_9BACL|nr:MFS transporter [Chengkuizengella sp. 2205SS18-9]MDP5276533.1 MFS transporter [Chengkuizengella sp. 2205SS18-9]
MINTKLVTTLGNTKSDAKNFFLFSFGAFISKFGASIYSFAISLYVLTVTGSGVSFAINLVLSMIPTVLLGPVAGVITDRVNRKWIIVLGDLVSGGVLLCLFIISFYQFHLYWIYMATFILNIIGTFIGVCVEAAKPNIVHDKNLMKLNSITRIIMSSSFILGPVLGGMAYAFIDQITIFILINAISFFVSSLAECFIDFKFNVVKNKSEKKNRFFNDMKEGFVYLFSKQQLRMIMILFICINFFTTLSAMIPIPYIITNVLKLDALAFGIIEGAYPIGMILGAIFIGKIVNNLNYHKFLIWITLIFSILFIAISIPVMLGNLTSEFVYIIYYFVINASLGMCAALADIPIMTILQKLVPDYLRGRVISSGITIVNTVVPFAMLLSGGLLNVLPIYWLPLFGGVLLFIIGVSIYISQTNNSTSLSLNETQLN